MKTNHTGGRDYFAITGEEAEIHIISLLKAFSQFKKWQQSNMQLVIVVKNIGSSLPFIEKLENYKYRKEVVICDQEDESKFTDLLAAAYCILYAGRPADTGTFLLDAFKSEVPVITTQASALAKLAGDAALYADMGNPESVSGQMIKIYKDEKLRNQLMDKGKERWPAYPKSDIQERLLQDLESVMNKIKT
jgi:glycosyltransferase involved in cell wall biosynthesis